MADIPPGLTPDGKLAWLKVQGRLSCLQCAYLFLQDRGYSNYTVEETDAVCALNRNPKLPDRAPWGDWNYDPLEDNWPATNNMVCEQLLEFEGDRAHLDVDGERRAADWPNLPQAAIDAIDGNE